MTEDDLTSNLSVYSSLQEIFATNDSILDLPEKPRKLTNTDRLERSFIEILDFVHANHREPSPNSRDISERQLGARLEGIRADKPKSDLLMPIDDAGLLVEAEAPSSLAEIFSQDQSENGFGLLNDASGLLDISTLPTPRKPHSDIGTNAQRRKCENFEEYEPFFKQKHAELKGGSSKMIRFGGRSRIVTGAFFVLNGVMVFVAEVGEVEYKKTTIRENRRERLRLVFENGTESSMYRQSLSLRLGEDDTAREVVDTNYQAVLDDDVATGWIYVLRSLSDDPLIAKKKNLYKIGFSTRPVQKRIANARNEPTYLMAPVEIVETYRTYNMKTAVLEHLLHRVFSAVRLNIDQTGKDGRHYSAIEWFEVPLPIIREAADLITSGEIINYAYDPKSNALREI